MPRIDIESDGFDRFKSFVDKFESKKNRDLRDAVDDISKVASHSIRLYSPNKTGKMDTRTESSIPRMEMSPAGPEIESIAGVRDGDKYPLYRSQGTGIYNRGGSNPIIKAKDPRKPMVFQKNGEPFRFVMWVKGMKPHFFMQYSYLQTNLYAQNRIDDLIDIDI